MTYFDKPNPPARVTIGCGKGFIPGRRVLIQYTTAHSPRLGLQRANPLHVQSRSYWAPANIGPYSQAHSAQCSDEDYIDAVYVAGQIALHPATTELVYDESADWRTNFALETVLSLQHLWRIGREMKVSWWTGAVAYLASGQGGDFSAHKARLAGKAWSCHHTARQEDSDGDLENFDVWDTAQLKYKNPMSNAKRLDSLIKEIPDRSVVSVLSLADDTSTLYIPPFFAAEVCELPKGGAIEWQALLGLTAGPIEVSCHTI